MPFSSRCHHRRWNRSHHFVECRTFRRRTHRSRPRSFSRYSGGMSAFHPAHVAIHAILYNWMQGGGRIKEEETILLEHCEPNARIPWKIWIKYLYSRKRPYYCWHDIDRYCSHASHRGALNCSGHPFVSRRRVWIYWRWSCRYIVPLVHMAMMHSSRPMTDARVHHFRSSIVYTRIPGGRMWPASCTTWNPDWPRKRRLCTREIAWKLELDQIFLYLMFNMEIDGRHLHPWPIP